MLLRVEGPSVLLLARVFPESLHEAAGVERTLPQTSTVYDDGARAAVHELNSRRGRENLTEALLGAVESARKRCYLITPYFVPALRFINALQHAARRDVDVWLLTAGRTDVPVARLASLHVFDGLLRSGVRIFEMTHPVLHAKALTIDGMFSSVGSYNFDCWSIQHSLESNVTVIDSGLAGKMKNYLLPARENRKSYRCVNGSTGPLTKRLRLGPCINYHACRIVWGRNRKRGCAGETEPTLQENRIEHSWIR